MRMVVRLGNFTKWRIRRISILVIGMLIAGSLVVCLKKSLLVNDLILLFGLAGSAVFMELPQIRGEAKNAWVVSDEQKIIVGDFTIDRKDIESVAWKEIRYGGRFLEIIGYRIVVKAGNKKYKLDSDFISNSYDPKTDFEKLKSLLECAKT